MESHDRIYCKTTKRHKQHKTINRELKLKKLNTSPNGKTKSKRGEFSNSSLLAPIKVKKRNSIKPEQEEEDIYASLLQDDNEIDHQICFGPWIKAKEDLKINQKEPVKQQPIRTNYRTILKPNFKNQPESVDVSINKKALPKFRSSSVLSKDQISPLTILKKQKSLFERKIEVFRDKSVTKIDLNKIESRYLDQKITQRFIKHQKSSATLDTTLAQKNKKAQRTPRISLGKYIENIKTLQPPNAFQTRIQVTPKLYQSIRSRRGSIPQIKNNIFNQTRNHLYDFKSLVPDRSNLKRTLQPVIPKNKPSIPQIQDPIPTQYHSLSTSCLRQSPNLSQQRANKFDKLLFVDKFRFSRPIM